MMWGVSAEREHRFKMPEVRIERVETILGFKCSIEDLADMFCNSPADSHLRDTGQSRSLSTRRHRRRRPVARAPHRKTRGQKTLDVEIRRSWDTACRAAVVKTFVYMRRSESTSSPMLCFRQQSVFGTFSVQERGWSAILKRGRAAWGELIVSEE